MDENIDYSLVQKLAPNFNEWYEREIVPRLLIEFRSDLLKSVARHAFIEGLKAMSDAIGAKERAYNCP
jgi:hypothetical protein